MTEQHTVQFPCPECGYELAGLRASTCPECGRAFDPRTVGQRKAKLSTAAIWIILAGGVLWYPLIGGALLIGGRLGNTSVSSGLEIVAPYAVIAGSFAMHSDNVGPIFGCLTFALVMLQGPAYGLILGLNWPPRQHRRVWIGLLATHTAAVLTVLLFCK